ncbi:MAG TPA: hypothetical protein VJ725_33950 [Thermoanaerobaculia bacterium]|nr:hypothetical protein [Thermoanaerobaculia bacterium]
MDEAKLLLFLFMALAGVVIYMVVTRDTSQGMWALAGILAAAAVAASVIELKKNPELVLRIAMLAALIVAIFAGILWLYTRNPISGKITAVTAPIAVVLAIGALRFRRRAEVRQRD